MHATPQPELALSPCRADTTAFLGFADVILCLVDRSIAGFLLLHLLPPRLPRFYALNILLSPNVGLPLPPR